MSNMKVKEQYAQLREPAETVEEERDRLRALAGTAEKARDIALADAKRWQDACEKSCDREGRSAEESRMLRDKLDRTLRDLEDARANSATNAENLAGALAEAHELRKELGELRVKATPSQDAIEAAGDQPSKWAHEAMAEFVLSLAKPKRKTRLDVYVEGWLEDGGEEDSSMLESVRREGIAQLKRQGLDPNAEIPDAPHG